jgi:hypothetical protein
MIEELCYSDFELFFFKYGSQTMMYKVFYIGFRCVTLRIVCYDMSLWMPHVSKIFFLIDIIRLHFRLAFDTETVLHCKFVSSIFLSFF